jgi:hypothetical protein
VSAGQDESRGRGGSEHRDQVPDRGDVELAQAGEDLPREHQQHEIDGGQHAREPGAAG